METDALENHRKNKSLASALSAKAAGAQIVVLDELKIDAPRTKVMADLLQGLVGEDSALILITGPDESLEKSVSNLPAAKTLRANYLNIRDLLGFDRLIMPLGALDVIQSYLGE